MVIEVVSWLVKSGMASYLKTCFNTHQLSVRPAQLIVFVLWDSRLFCENSTTASRESQGSVYNQVQVPVKRHQHGVPERPETLFSLAFGSRIQYLSKAARIGKIDRGPIYLLIVRKNCDASLLTGYSSAIVRASTRDSTMVKLGKDIFHQCEIM